MNKNEMIQMERMIVRTYDFSAEQHFRLEESQDYDTIVKLAHEDKWASVEVKIAENDYFS